MKNLQEDNLIYINFLNTWSVLKPDSFKIRGIKNIFQNIPNESLVSCLFQDKKTKKIGIALLNSKTIEDINDGKIWSDEKKTRSFNSFSPSTVQEIQEKSAKKIADFFLTKTICFDSGICMAFGRYNKMIEKYFEGFEKLKFLQTPIQRISNGANGFVHELVHKRGGYVANSILKSSRSETSDNLFYEYLVGQYTNKLCPLFPCFIKTYGWFVHTPDEYLDYFWDFMSQEKNTEIDDKNELINTLKIKSPVITQESFEFACSHSKYLAILIQHVKSGIVLEERIKNSLLTEIVDSFLTNEIINILYQVYMPLATLANTFTHYDLHTSNVLLCEPVLGKYIDYKYILNDGNTIEFKSKYIVKIIDYGRSFFDDQFNTDISGSSKKIYETILGIKKCTTTQNTEINYLSGFQNMEPDDGNFYYISSSTRNISHDLRLLFELKIKLEKYYGFDRQKLEVLNPGLLKIFDIIEYGRTQYNKDGKIWSNYNVKNPLFKDALYGTKEIYDSNPLVDGMPTKITNVIDAHQALKKIILDTKDANEEYYKSMETLGTFLIYESGEIMKFEKSKKKK